MMDRPPLNTEALQAFLADAQALLGASQECLLHLELISDDADACQCLGESLATLADRADAAGITEVAHYACSLQHLLEPVCLGRNLPRGALPALADCLTLLAWQLELVDPQTGHLNLDTSEQHLLLLTLAEALGQPLPQRCARCTEHDQHCMHPPLLQGQVGQRHLASTGKDG